MISVPFVGSLQVPRLTIGSWIGIVIALAVYAYMLAIAFQLGVGDQGCTIALGLFSGWCGSKTGIAMAIAIIMLPPALVFAIKRPWMFPVAFYALLVPSDSYLSLSSGGTLTKLAGAMALLALLFWVVRKRAITAPGIAATVWIGYFIWATASLLWAVSTDPNVFSYFGTMAMLVALFLAFVITPVDESEFNTLMTAFIVGSCIAAVFGAIVFHGTSHLNHGRLKAHFDTENKLSSDFFAASLVFPIAAVVMAALRERLGIKKVAYLVAFALLMVGQYVVGSRGALVGDAVAICYFFWKNRYRAQLIFVTVTGLLVSLLYPAVWLRFVAPDVKGGDNGGSGRIPIWKVGIVAFKHYWLFGAGLDNFTTAYNHFYLSVFSTFVIGWNKGPHNILIEAAVELGIVGLILLLLGWWYIFRAVRHIPIGHRLYDLRIMLEGAVLGTFVNAQFVHIMHQKFTWWMFAVVIMAATMSRGVLAKEGVTLLHDDRAGPTPTSVLPPPPILERTL